MLLLHNCKKCDIVFLMKRIVIATQNDAKVQAAKKHFVNLYGTKVEIIKADVDSYRNNRPINDEIYRRIISRINEAVKQYRDADAYVAIEGGFFEVPQRNHKQHFIGTIASVYSDLETRIGASDFYIVPETAFECAKMGLSLNEILHPFNSEEFRTDLGIIGFLTHGKVDRNLNSSQALERTTLALDHKEQGLRRNLRVNLSPNYTKLGQVCSAKLYENH